MYKVFTNSATVCIASASQQDVSLQGFLVYCEPDDRLIRNVIGSALRLPEKFMLLSENPDQLFARFASHFTLIEAAGGIVRNSKGDMLFIIRYGKYDLPKGKIESGESAETAAVREVAEETGIVAVSKGKMLYETYHTYKINGDHILKRTRWFDMQAEGTPTGSPQLSESISEIIWVRKDAVRDILPLTYPALADMLFHEYSG